jgi:cytidylate kinase-like protein
MGSPMTSGPYRPKGIHTANVPFAEADLRGIAPAGVRPFVTIAQQAGAERPDLPRRLAEMLSGRAPSRAPWVYRDQDLIERVAAEAHVPAELVAALENSKHSWIDDLLSGLAGHADEWGIFHRLRDSIRDVAARGHVILVGHGSTYFTSDFPHGVHVRLIAPGRFRALRIAEQRHLSLRDAARYRQQLDRRRDAFYARFWPGRPLAPERFAVEFNVATLDDQRIAAAIAALVPRTA